MSRLSQVGIRSRFFATSLTPIIRFTPVQISTRLFSSSIEKSSVEVEPGTKKESNAEGIHQNEKLETDTSNPISDWKATLLKANSNPPTSQREPRARDPRARDPRARDPRARDPRARDPRFQKETVANDSIAQEDKSVKKDQTFLQKKSFQGDSTLPITQDFTRNQVSKERIEPLARDVTRDETKPALFANSKRIKTPSRPQPSQLLRSWDPPKAESDLSDIDTPRVTPYVLITQLPISVLPGDIQRMTLMDKELKNSIIELCYWRTGFFQFQGRIAVKFANDQVADRFMLRNRLTFVGGQKIGFDTIGEALYQKNRKPELLEFPGQHVQLVGVPKRVSPEELRFLLGEFDITDYGIQELRCIEREISAKWLIRLESKSEAYRLVRSVHNRYFQPDIYQKDFVVRANVVY